MLEDFGTNVPEKIRCLKCNKEIPLTAAYPSLGIPHTIYIHNKGYYCYPCWECIPPSYKKIGLCWNGIPTEPVIRR